MPKRESTGHESTEEYETRCFLNIYKELKDEKGTSLNTDQLLLLLQQRFDLPKSIEEDAEFKVSFLTKFSLEKLNFFLLKQDFYHTIPIKFRLQDI